MKKSVFMLAILCICTLFALSVFAVPSAVEATDVTEACTKEHDSKLFSEWFDYTVNTKIQNGIVNAKDLYVKAIDSNTLTVTFSGISVKDMYITNLSHTERDYSEYNWEIWIYLPDETFVVSTSSWAYEPGLNLETHILDMQHSVWRDDGDSFNWIAESQMSYTPDSITWTFSIPDEYSFDFSSVTKFSTRVSGTEQDYVSRLYNVAVASEGGTAEIVESGTCGENLTWTLDTEGTLTISGEGTMENAERESRWYDYNSSIFAVVIEEGVTSICDYAFSDLQFFKEIVIPDSVTTIGKRAFSNCEGIEQVTFGNGLEFVDMGAFSNCSGIKKVNLTDLENWFEVKFDGFTSNPMYYSENCYVNDVLISEIVVPESVSVINDCAFYGADNIKRIEIHEGVVSIGADSFNGNGVEEYIVDSGNMFYSNDMTGVLFNKDKTTLLRYPDGNKATTYVISDTVKNIEKLAFGVCRNLKSVTIPGSVENIGERAFITCTSLTKFVVGSDNGFYSVDSAGVLHNKDKTVLICYPIASSMTAYTVCDSVKTIEIFAFYDFYGCGKLNKIVLGDGVETIGNSAFGYSKSLRTVILGKNVSKIGDSVFYKCVNLSKIDLPSSLIEIGYSAFCGCVSLKSIMLPEGVARLHDGAFARCENLEKVIIPGKTMTFDDGVFGDCINLTIYGYSNSDAERYAEENNIPFAIYDGTYEPEEETVMTGELNGDGVVDMNDAILLLQYSMFPELYPLDYAGSVDFTKDGNIDLNDAILLLQYSMFPELYPIS